MNRKKFTTNETGAFATYLIITLWSYLLSNALGINVLNFHVSTFVTIFTTLLTLLLPFYWLRIRQSYLVGTLIVLCYMIGGTIIDYPAPWISNPTIGNIIQWTIIYTLGTVGAIFSIQAYRKN